VPDPSQVPRAQAAPVGGDSLTTQLLQTAREVSELPAGTEEHRQQLIVLRNLADMLLYTP